uniref:histidine kinase n=1 Tax=termite gut metagenome TaxID=433724 RepID=S0DEJ7_9ZZZZ
MDNGLPHNSIDDIFKDSRGFLWISTAGGGLCRYDGYEFIDFNPETPHCKLKSNFIRNVCEDGFERLWVVSEGGTDIIDLGTLQSGTHGDPKGLLTEVLRQPAQVVMLDSQGSVWLQSGGALHRITFDAKGDAETVLSLDLPELNEPDLVLKDIDADGKIWTGIAGTVFKIGPATQGELEQHPVSDVLAFRQDIYFRDMLAKENEVWIATDLGLFRYNKNSNAVKQYENIEGDPRSISQNFVTSLAVTDDKQLIAGTLRGANIYNPITDDFERLVQSSGAGSLLNSNFINCIKVEGGHIWLGTESGGINKLAPKRLAIHNYRHDKEDPSSLSDNPVNAIFEDTDGVLWVGTVEGGLNRKAKGEERFTHYTYERGDISHNSVSSITADGQGRLWVGTWGGGINILDAKAPRHSGQVIGSVPDTGFPLSFVSVLIYDPVNNGMWVGANRGLFFYDLATREFVSPFAGHAAENIRGCLGATIDRENNLWIGATEGVYIIDLDSRSQQPDGGEFRYRHLRHKLDDPRSGLIEKISCFCESKDGTLWLGSNGYGIYKRVIDLQGTESFISYSTAHGLSNNNVRSMQEDPHGNIWIGTNNGLSCYRPAENRFTNYTQQDGLPDEQFYWNASLSRSDGTLWFGTVVGLTLIENRLPDLPLQPAGLRFTRLRIGNEDILPGSKWLSRDIAVTEEIKLHEKEKSFSLEFSALDFEPSNTTTYAYRLLGFENEWIQVPGDRRFAGYTNLRPGTYTLQVKYTPDGDSGTESRTELKITVIPHFYKTVWFTLIVIALVSLMIGLLFRWRIQNLKRQRELLHRRVEERTRQLERQKEQLSRMARKVQGLTEDKIAFFTNITHEFRTPITLIIGPIERALRLSYNPQVIEQLNFVERNSKYLLSLVNQLMDFRKVESGRLEIVKARGNFVEFIRSLLTPFEVFAGERDIVIKHHVRMKSPEIVYDEEAMHKVITNLLSNAIKYTPNGGTISLYIATLPTGKFYICVGDTGTGIPRHDLEQIFDRFYQSKKQARYPAYGQTGTGIGLYLCKRIVEMHDGEITVRNNPAAGCSFRILLPLTQEESPRPIAGNDALPAAPAPEAPDYELPKENAALTILVVEDNADMRGYIRSILRDSYNVLEATNGAEALEILNNRPVDFIISDLMMPVMDGIELSRRVKETFAISHIPFLMLTAKTSQEARLESYRTGVDEYLLKPFDETLLLTRIENILENRNRYKRKFKTSMDVEVLNIAEESGDKKFIDQVMEVVKEHYKNPYFEVGDFCEAVGVSKSLLNKKLQSLIGQSAGQIIRNYRLNTARELILRNRETRQMNIAEIAYETGFNDPKYFARCFHKRFDMKPSDLMNSDGEEQ